tara:strand:+ start:1756 stop:2046 length:291 start_codon:yes stop_codon:yes gene_type:complete
MIVKIYEYYYDIGDATWEIVDDDDVSMVIVDYHIRYLDDKLFIDYMSGSDPLGPIKPCAKEGCDEYHETYYNTIDFVKTQIEGNNYKVIKGKITPS